MLIWLNLISIACAISGYVNLVWIPDPSLLFPDPALDRPRMGIFRQFHVSGSHMSCRYAARRLIELNPESCRTRFTEDQLTHAVHSNHAQSCPDRTLCTGEAKCVVTKDVAGCRPRFLQNGLDIIGHVRFFCDSIHPHLALNNEGNPDRTFARCLNDHQRARRHETLNELERKKDVERLKKMMDEPAEGTSTSRLQRGKSSAAAELGKVGQSFGCLDIGASKGGSRS